MPLLLSLAVMIAEMGLVTYAEGPWPFGGGAARELVVRSPAELATASGSKDAKRAEADLAKALKVKEIDWQRQMAIVLRLEKIHPDRGVRFGPLRVKEGTLTVQYAYWQPVAAREGDPDPKPTDVAKVFLVDRFDGKVVFKPDARMPK